MEKIKSYCKELNNIEFEIETRGANYYIYFNKEIKLGIHISLQDRAGVNSIYNVYIFFNGKEILEKKHLYYKYYEEHIQVLNNVLRNKEILSLIKSNIGGIL